MNRNRCLCVIDIIVAPGTQVTIVTQKQFLHKGRMFEMPFCLTCPQKVEFSKINGNEVVFIQNGVNGDTHQLLDRAADLFYADLLHLGREYCLRFGNNGLPSSVTHFINLNSPCCARPFDPNNANDGPIFSE